MKTLSIQEQKDVIEGNVKNYLERTKVENFPKPSEVKIPIFCGHKVAKELKEEYIKKGWGIKEKGNITYLLFIPEK